MDIRNETYVGGWPIGTSGILCTKNSSSHGTCSRLSYSTNTTQQGRYPGQNAAATLQMGQRIRQMGRKLDTRSLLYTYRYGHVQCSRLTSTTS